jgi:hypothetical protein
MAWVWVAHKPFHTHERGQAVTDAVEVWKLYAVEVITPSRPRLTFRTTLGEAIARGASRGGFVRTRALYYVLILFYCTNTGWQHRAGLVMGSRLWACGAVLSLPG